MRDDQMKTIQKILYSCIIIHNFSRDLSKRLKRKRKLYILTNAMIIQKSNILFFCLLVKCTIYDAKYELLLSDKNRKGKRIKDKTKNEIKSGKLVFAIF